MYRLAQQQRHYRYEGKRHGKTKRALFPSYRQRSKSLLHPGFGGVKRGFAGVFAPYRPVLALVQHFGVLREPPPPQNRWLHRYGMKEEHNWSFFLHTGTVFHTVQPCYSRR